MKSIAICFGLAMMSAASSAAAQSVPPCTEDETGNSCPPGSGDGTVNWPAPVPVPNPWGDGYYPGTTIDPCQSWQQYMCFEDASQQRSWCYCDDTENNSLIGGGR